MFRKKKVFFGRLGE